MVAVREKNVLRLYINGKEVAVSGRFDNDDFPMSNRAPLLIGLGAQTNFSGSMADVRFYGGALSAGQKSRICLEGGPVGSPGANDCRALLCGLHRVNTPPTPRRTQWRR